MSIPLLSADTAARSTPFADSPHPDVSQVSVPSSLSAVGGGNDVAVLSEDDVWGAYETLLRRKRRSPTTIGLYRTALHDLWAFGAKRGLRWWQATPELVDTWLERACKPGKHGAGMPLSEGTRNTYGRDVQRFYAVASKRGWLEGGSPLEDWAPPPPPPARPRALPVAEIGRLLLLVDPRIRLMVLIGYHQALRVGEIVKLSVQDLALHADPPMLLVHGKGGKQVWMPLSPALVGPLRSFMLTRPTQGALIPNFRDPARHLDPKYATALLAAAMRPVVGDSGHALRHTAAQQLRRLTKDPFIVRDALRHSSVDMQSSYVGADLELLAGALAKLPNPLQEAR